MPAATIFVRHTASTERATPDDIDMLSRRAARQAGSELDIDVRAVEGTELGRVDCRVGTIEAFAATEEQRLLSRLTRSQAGGAVSNALFSVVEHRSAVDFRKRLRGTSSRSNSAYAAFSWRTRSCTTSDCLSLRFSTAPT